MRARNIFPLLLLFGLTTMARGDDALPKTAPFSHYAPMVKRSPFAVATATAPLGGKPDFAKDLYVANAAHSTDGDFVTIASTTDKNLKEYLNTREVVDGYSISNISRRQPASVALYRASGSRNTSSIKSRSKIGIRLLLA